MTTLSWDELGERIYETGIDKGVLYIPDETGAYDSAVAWNGIVSVSESNSGGAPVTVYADNRKYISLSSDADFSATLQAYTYPDEFAPFDGLLVPTDGLIIGQQSTDSFGLSYRSLIGNALEGHSPEVGYKLHLVWNATATPSDKVYSTVSDASNPVLFSWKLDTVPVPITIGKPTAHIAIVSTKVDSAKLLSFEQIIYGDADTPPRLPTPNEVIEHFMGPSEPVLELVYVYVPTLNDGTGILSIPDAYGIDYRIDGIIVTGTINVDYEEVVTVVAAPKVGFRILGEVQSQTFEFTRSAYGGTDIEMYSTPYIPEFNRDTNEITIPTVTGITYKRNGITITGVYTIAPEETLVEIHAVANPGYRLVDYGNVAPYHSFDYTYKYGYYDYTVLKPTPPDQHQMDNFIFGGTGVNYTRALDPVYSGPVYLASGETVTVSLIPDSGYTFAEALSNYEYTFSYVDGGLYSSLPQDAAHPAMTRVPYTNTYDIVVDANSIVYIDGLSISTSSITLAPGQQIVMYQVPKPGHRFTSPQQNVLAFGGGFTEYDPRF